MSVLVGEYLPIFQVLASVKINKLGHYINERALITDIIADPVYFGTNVKTCL